MYFERSVTPWGRIGLVAMTALLGCQSDPTGPEVGAESVYIEVHVTGGFAGVDYTYAIAGEALELRGIACVSVCDFEPGERLEELTPAQVLYFTRLLTDAGIHEYDGSDFGDECCDQFHYAVELREGGRESTVTGATGTLPEDLSRAIGETQELLSGRLPILIQWESTPQDWPGDPLALHSVSLDGSVLSLEVEYGGGCDRHDHDLVAWGGWMESFPVQVNLLLTHDDHDDPCDGLIRRTLRFDLTRLRDAYLGAYPGSAPGVTTLALWLTAPDGEDAHRIDYTF